MNNRKPYLSICIPTYNRSSLLDKCLASLICQPEINGNEVEIIISDNCSEDDTALIADKYCKLSNNIHYYKNEQNIKDRNFPLALSRANGSYRKLSNDSLIYEKDSLKKMLEIIKQNLNERPVLFFHSGQKDDTIETNLNVFLKRVSFQITSIACYGVWENDFELDYYGCDKSLWQVPHTIESFLKKGRALIITDRLFHREIEKKKDISYGLYRVFYENYLGFLLDYCNSGLISKDCYEYLKKDLLLNFFTTWVSSYLVEKNKYKYDCKEDLYESIKKEYQNEKYYFKYLIKLNSLCFKKRIKKIINGD